MNVRFWRRPSVVVLWITFAGITGIGLAQSITEFPLPTAGSGPFGIAAGPDGALWFTEQGTDKIGRMDRNGAVTEYSVPPVPVGGSGLGDITLGPDGAMWFGETLHVGRIDTNGVVTQYQTDPGPSGQAILAGPDGALWFVEFFSHTLGRIDTAGRYTGVYGQLDSMFSALTLGPDGAMWIGVAGSPPDLTNIRKVTLSGAVAAEYKAPNYPYSMAAGRDGAIWFTVGNSIGRVAVGGAITYYPIPTPSSSPNHIISGPDGALWFAEAAGNKIGRISTNGVITEYPLPTAANCAANGSIPERLAVGPDGAIWFTESCANKIGRIDLGPLAGGCAFAISPAAISAPSGAGGFTSLTGTFTLTATNCAATDAWTAISDSPRLIVNASGNGAAASTTVTYSLFDNTSAQARNFHVNVAGRTFTITQAGSTETKPQRVVRALYQTILGREPDPEGFAFWTGPGAPVNSSGAVLYNQMADGFYASPEFKNSGWLALNLYQVITGSLPSFAAWNQAVARIRNGALTGAQLADSLAGTMSNSTFVQTVFQNAFGRAPAAAELSAGVSSLNGGQSKLDFLNTAIFPNSDFTSRTNPAFVRALFFTILVRDADPEGTAFWLDQLNPPDGQNGIYYSYNPQPPTPQYGFKLAVIGQAVPPNPNLLGFLGSPEFQGLIQ